MSIKEQLISLFIVPGIPEDFSFKTRTRKEISVCANGFHQKPSISSVYQRIEWFKLTDLPTWKRNKAAPGKFYLISPFIAYVPNDYYYKRLLIAHNRALKAFITARKPRAFESRNRKCVPYVSGGRGAQESSSSSADTGEPQTPSPQYSKAVPVTNDHLITRHELDEEKGALTEPLDPHFARLLNSLSISASKNVDPKPPNTLKRVAPASKTIPSSNRSQTPDWSSRVPTFSEALINSPGLSPAQHISTQDSHNCENCSDLLPCKESEVAPGPSNTPLVAVANAASSSAVTTGRKPFMSRRSSSIADISPYLSRPAEVPASGKRLKQLALLESVADESSKLTPTLVNRELPPIHGPDCRPGFSGPSTSVPPTPYATQVNVRASYESGTPVSSLHSIRGANLPPLHALHDHSILDPFQVRPRSSQLHHSTSYPECRNVKNQNQVLSLLSGPSHVPPPGNFAKGPQPATFPQAFPPSYPTTTLHSSTQSNIVQSIYPYATASENVVASKPFHSFQIPRDPHGAPATHAVLPPQSRSPLPPSSVQLLSILNGDRASGTHASVSRAGPPSLRAT